MDKKSGKFAVIVYMTLNHFNNEDYSLSFNDLVTAIKTEVNRGQEGNFYVSKDIVDTRKRIYLALLGAKLVERQNNKQHVLTERGKQMLKFNLVVYETMIEEPLEPLPVNLDALFEGRETVTVPRFSSE